MVDNEMLGEKIAEEKLLKEENINDNKIKEKIEVDKIVDIKKRFVDTINDGFVVYKKDKTQNSDNFFHFIGFNNNKNIDLINERECIIKDTILKEYYDIPQFDESKKYLYNRKNVCIVKAEKETIDYFCELMHKNLNRVKDIYINIVEQPRTYLIGYSFIKEGINIYKYNESLKDEQKKRK